MQPSLSRSRRGVSASRGRTHTSTRNFMSLRSKLITGIVCAIAVVSLCRGVIEINDQTVHIARELAVKADNMAAMAADLAALPLVINDDAAIARAMKSLTLDSDIAYLQVVDVMGATRCELGARRDDLIMTDKDIIYSDDYPMGRLYMGISRDRIIITRNDEIVYDLIASGITLLALVLLVSIITHYFMAPMEALKDTVARMSRGEYAARTNTRTNDEIGVLARFIDDNIEIITQREERLRITLESIGDGVIATDNQGIVTLMNGVAAEFTGWPVSEAVGRPLSQVFSIRNEGTGEPEINPVDKVLNTGAVVELGNHTVLYSRDGMERSIANSAAPILDRGRNIVGVIMVVRDVSEQKHKEEERVYQSYHDMLTGLYNRSFFEEELRRLDQGRQMPISIIMGDVNGLKLANDVFGHDEGDNLLRRVAAVLSASCRADDIIARTGGDEFCILLPRTGARDAGEVCQRIYSACAAQQTEVTPGRLRLSISLGHATKESAEHRLHSVLRAAEDSMYKRKLLESRGQHSSIITAIRSTLSEKSYETEDHSYRLMNYARMVGMKAMLNSDQLSDLELLAVMHDIGKIAVDDSVLNKEGPLSDEEWDQIKKHPDMGYRIASVAPELMTIAYCILAHHERWDGKGYPQGLSGADIPLLSRILTIVDSYDAMTQDRVYHKAIDRRAALAELRRNAGTQFDPELVVLFIQCIQEAEEYLS